MNLYYWQEDTSIGIITVVMAGEKCCRLAFASEELAGIKNWLARVFPGCKLTKDKQPAVFVLQQLDNYLKGNLENFNAPLLFQGTAFQQKVWQELLKIPYGETVNYGYLAEKSKSSPRAIGGAMGANPIAIIAPCHRIIGSDGNLTGFGGGLPVKKKLLEIESIIPSKEESPSGWISRHPQKPRYLGNRARKTYCLPQCPKLIRQDLRKKVPALFSTKQEAELMGYKACASCLG